MQTTTTDTPQPPIVGWEKIAAETGKSINQSVTVVTARRWAKPGRDLRLPVYKYGDGRVYMTHPHLALFAAAWLSPIPVGGSVPGAPKVRRPKRRKPKAKTVAKPRVDGAITCAHP